MKMSWDVPQALLRFEAETEADLDTIAMLTGGPLAGAQELRVQVAESRFGATRAGRRYHIGREPLLLEGLVWDIRNQPQVGRARSDADAQAAQVTQAAGKALHELIRLVQRQA